MKRFKKLLNWIKSHKIVLSLVVFLLFLAAIWLPSRVKALIQGPEAKYEITTPKKADLIQAVDVSGKIRAEQQVVLRFQTSGQLAWVGVKEGDKVKKWQALASLDKRELKKNLEKELYDYLSERWDFEQAHEDYDTSGKELRYWLVSDAGKRILQKAQFDLNQTVLDYEIDIITVELATLISPIDGIVTEIDTPVAGVNITPAAAEFTVSNPEVMVFEALIDEADIGLVKEGQDVVITLDAYPDEEFAGIVGKIDFTATTTSGGGTAFPAQIVLPENESLRFKIGMNGDAEIIVAQKENALYLPLSAIKEKNGQSYVEIIENRKIKEVEVQTGLSTDSRLEIISGLSGEEKVITGEKK